MDATVIVGSRLVDTRHMHGHRQVTVDNDTQVMRNILTFSHEKFTSLKMCLLQLIGKQK